MSITVTISDDLAALLEARRKEHGLETLDSAVETLLAYALASYDEEDDLFGYSAEELRALIAEADASGPAEPWDAKAVREEVLRRHAERTRQS